MSPRMSLATPVILTDSASTIFNACQASHGHAKKTCFLAVYPQPLSSWSKPSARCPPSTRSDGLRVSKMEAWIAAILLDAGGSPSPVDRALRSLRSRQAIRRIQTVNSAGTYAGRP